MNCVTARVWRLFVWTASAAIALPVQMIARAMEIRSRAVTGSVYIALLTILYLLATTPSDAIRLRRWVSEVVIVGGTFGLLLLARPPFVHTVTVVAGVVVLQIGSRLLNWSPWWAVLMAWNPLLMSGRGTAVR